MRSEKTPHYFVLLTVSYFLWRDDFLSCHSDGSNDPREKWYRSHVATQRDAQQMLTQHTSDMEITRSLSCVVDWAGYPFGGKVANLLSNR